jgi:hypothetical protein
MNILEDLLLGRQRRTRREPLPGFIGALSKWIVGCGCLLVAAAIAGVILLMAGIISVSESAMTYVVVIATIIVAIASLIRTSAGY